MDGGQPEIKRGRKFDQVLAGAREVFLSSGFEGASVDEIAKRANVSKATLYSYFPDKRALFLEVARQECATQADAMQLEHEDLPVEEMLLKFGSGMMQFLMSDFAHRIFRICVAESDRFPDLAREFYDSGPKLINGCLVTCFKHACAKGELKIDDISLAAHQFQELVKADLFVQKVFNKLDHPDPAQMQKVVEAAVAMFLARYGVNRDA